MTIGFQETILDTKNALNQTLLNVQEKIASSADVSNLTGAMSQDMSVLTMAFQEVGNLPGMKTITAGIKFLAAWAATIIGPIIKAWWTKEKGKKLEKPLKQAKGAIPADYGAGVYGGATLDTSQMSFDFGGDTPKKKKEEGSKDKRTIGGELDLRSHSKVEKGLDNMTKNVEGYTKNISGSFSEAFKESSEKTKEMTQGFIDFFKFKGIRTTMATAVKDRWKSFKTWMVGQRESFMANTKMGKAMRRGGKLIGNAAKLLKVGAISLAGSIMGAVAGFLLAALPFLAIVVLVVLIVVGIVYLIKMIMDKWEVIKVKMAMAIDRLALWGKKAKNWFSDLGGDIYFRIGWLIDKIKDGLASMANAVIKKLNKWFGLDIEEFEGGNVDATMKEREKELARRAERDTKLQADFDAKYAERGKELEDAAKKDVDRKIKKEGGGDTDIKTSTVVTTDNREVTMVAENTSSGDQWAMLATQQRG
jgi:hypothetical protein